MYGDFYDKDKTVARPSYLQNWKHYTGGTAGGRLNIKMSSYQYKIPMLKIRRSHDRLIF